MCIYTYYAICTLFFIIVVMGYYCCVFYIKCVGPKLCVYAVVLEGGPRPDMFFFLAGGGFGHEISGVEVGGAPVGVFAWGPQIP